MAFKEVLILSSITYLVKSANLDEFDKHGIIPGIIDKAPKSVSEVSFLNSKVNANLGNELTPDEAKDEPLVIWTLDNNTFYTIIMIDPDVPSREKPERTILHWLVVNIPAGNIKSGNHLANYHGPAPRKGHGLHRYIFLVYGQSSKVDLSEFDREKRFKFSTKSFTQQYNLGEPVAGNFFLAQNQGAEYPDAPNKQ